MVTPSLPLYRHSKWGGGHLQRLIRSVGWIFTGGFNAVVLRLALFRGCSRLRLSARRRLLTLLLFRRIIHFLPCLETRARRRYLHRLPLHLEIRVPSAPLSGPPDNWQSFEVRRKASTADMAIVKARDTRRALWREMGRRTDAQYKLCVHFLKFRHCDMFSSIKHKQRENYACRITMRRNCTSEKPARLISIRKHKQVVCKKSKPKWWTRGLSWRNRWSLCRYDGESICKSVRE